MKQNFRKTIATLLTGILLFYNLIVPVYALDIPSAPEVPSVPVASNEPPSAPETPAAPSVPTQEEVLNPTPEPTRTPSDNSNNGNIENEEQNNDSGTSDSNNSSPSSETQNAQPSSSATPALGTSTGEQTSSGNPTAPSITTADANTTGVIDTIGNSNTSAMPIGSGGSATVSNNSNGEGSTNSGSATVSNNDSTIQNNSAQVANNMNQEAVSGQNTASDNLGGAEITAGESNVTGTIVTSVNTNVTGVAVYEFKVADTQVGDLVIDYNNLSNCVSGCEGSTVSASNTDNGASSTNTANVSTTNNDATFQDNDAAVQNNMTLLADSGNNKTNDNIGGNTSITTNDANVNANVLTFANNNIAGNVIYGVVNIYGTLVGDIVLPEEALTCSINCGMGQVTAENTGNLASSTNAANVSTTNNGATFQTNDATIANNLILDAITGDNQATDNIGGNTSISTGESSATVQAVNIANSNVEGGNWWLVIVNEAGQWVGRLLGSPDGTNYAGSTGTEFVVDENGGINVTNSGNGAGSNNTANVSTTNNNTTVQNNTASVTNNLNLTANTGGNTASYNGGGNTSIKTGDATIVANLVNFVNNNITGGGRLVVTVVNVFGSWLGDFVTPGMQKENQLASDTLASQLATQKGSGPANEKTSSSASSGETSSNQSNPSSNNQPTPTPTKKLSGSVRISSNSKVGEVVLGVTDNESGNSITKKSSPTSLVGGVQESNKIKINLAWVILALPFLLAFYLQRKFALFTGITKRVSAFLF